MKALLIVDLQRDFVEGGALPVPNGLEVVEPINRLMETSFWARIIATKDWHPAGHVSFASTFKKPVFSAEACTVNGQNYVQSLWPDHCVQETDGADFVPELNKSKIDKVIYKGTSKSVDSYSGFRDVLRQNDTELHDYLCTFKVTDLVIVGLALDYCVKATALDAIDMGYKVSVQLCCTRAVSEATGKQALEELRQAGVKIL